MFDLTQFYFCLVGQEIRDRFSGAVEAFARKNSTGHAMHRDRSRHRSSDDVPSSKDVVSSAREIKRNYVSFNFVELLDLFS
jgi:hypothetical protein